MTETDTSDLLLNLANIPEELRERAQWVLWRRELRLEQVTKVPYAACSQRPVRASSTNPDTWSSFDQAVEAFRSRRAFYDGIGFVLSQDDPYVGVDLDHCITQDEDGTQRIEDWALGVLWRLHSYSEVSPSGTGLRVFVRGQLPPGRRKLGQFEIYEHSRYLTITGNHVPCAGGPYCLTDNCGPTAVPRIEERTTQLAVLHEDVFGREDTDANANANANAGAPQPPQPPQLLWVGSRNQSPEDDSCLIERASNALNGLRFRALWFGSWAGHRSHSEADLALCSHLLYWCDGDAVQADRLFRQSGLFRGKWDERHAADGRTYGQLTMGKAQEGAGSTACPEGPAFMDEAANRTIRELFHGR